jgi:hypothetical protein
MKTGEIKRWSARFVKALSNWRMIGSEPGQERINNLSGKI